MRLLPSVLMFALVTCWSASLPGRDSRNPLPQGVFKALASQEKDYCDHFEDKSGCHRTFRTHLRWTKLIIAPSGEIGFLVENRESCGSAGCELSLFTTQADDKYIQVLGTDGEVGTLGSIVVLRKIQKDHYVIQKTWHDGKTKTLYVWDGSRYSAQ